MKIINTIKKIEAGHYEVYSLGASEPYAHITRISSHRWLVNLHTGHQYDFRTLSECKVLFYL